MLQSSIQFRSNLFIDFNSPWSLRNDLTHFVAPTGLSSENVLLCYWSDASEISKPQTSSLKSQLKFIFSDDLKFCLMIIGLEKLLTIKLNEWLISDYSGIVLCPALLARSVACKWFFFCLTNNLSNGRYITHKSSPKANIK